MESDQRATQKDPVAYRGGASLQSPQRSSLRGRSLSPLWLELVPKPPESLAPSNGAGVGCTCRIDAGEDGPILFDGNRHLGTNQNRRWNDGRLAKKDWSTPIFNEMMKLIEEGNAKSPSQQGSMGMLTELMNRKAVRLVRASLAPHAASLHEVRFSVFMMRSKVSRKIWGLSWLLILRSSSSE